MASALASPDSSPARGHFTLSHCLSHAILLDEVYFGFVQVCEWHIMQLGMLM